MPQPRNFGLIGAAGYIAPRHMKAINDTGNRLVAALDPNDSVGTMDQYAPDASFFTEFERFDRHAEKLRRRGENERLHYVSICSPNYLHDAHCRFALRIGADAICEKPLVLNPWNVDALQEIEQETGQRIWNVLQLRLHPAVIALKNRIDAENTGKRHHVELTYVTPRGKWYDVSWKGHLAKSGGVASNIGIHFFDMLMWVFGDVQHSSVTRNEPRTMTGQLSLEKADVRWHLSVNAEELPAGHAGAYRSLTLDGDAFDFSGGFTDLHTRVYEEALKGKGFSLDDVRPSIALAERLR
ncbi:MAG: Gfo/Idh/MocA family oxidoreductase [Bacteroidetes bacterium]|nr:Gfo/Idh/MocA family oxidoreductase [Bacteroidota bacterium]MDA0874590.1 Gfo/Idh/MocA family oxidoreductase [Bacteroidota bacterium]